MKIFNFNRNPWSEDALLLSAQTLWGSIFNRVSNIPCCLKLLYLEMLLCRKKINYSIFSFYSVKEPALVFPGAFLVIGYLQITQNGLKINFASCASKDWHPVCSRTAWIRLTWRNNFLKLTILLLLVKKQIACCGGSEGQRWGCSSCMLSTCLLEGHSGFCSFPSTRKLVRPAGRQCWFCKDSG